MPRTGKGGARQGTAGQAYGNRTDLNGGKMPITAAPNQEYGKAGAQRAAQGAVPMATPSVSTNPLQTTQSQGTPMPAPGSMPFLHPTNRPDEPITAGAPYGPGPNTMSPPPLRLSETLGAYANSSNASSVLMELAATARNLGI